MQLNLQYTHSNNIGYGRHGIELHRGLTASGVEVFDHLPQLGEPVGPSVHAGVAPVVCWLCVPSHVAGWVEGQYRVAYTMWEGTRLPEGFRDALDDFDMIVVPSVENVELFSRHHDNVKLVYEGVNPEVWNYVPRQTGPFFNFLIGGSGERKGVDLAYDAFIKVFGDWAGDGPIPRLICKSPRGETFTHDRVEVISGKLSDEDEVALYASAHCYVQPSRGEGFGLQPLQALAQGMPTILTDAHGHKAYSHLGVGLSASLTKAGYFVYGDAGDWWEPDFDELCDAMRDVYDNYDRHVASAKLASEVVASEWTWKRSAEQFIAAVGDRLNDPAPPASAQLVKPTKRRYKVVTRRDWSADIGGVSYRFNKGQTYWEQADVKRVLFDADLLDPESLTGDSGLSPDQVRRIPDYTAAVEPCPTCGQVPA